MRKMERVIKNFRYMSIAHALDVLELYMATENMRDKTRRTILRQPLLGDEVD
jgi:hypothetical protein